VLCMQKIKYSNASDFTEITKFLNSIIFTKTLEINFIIQQEAFNSFKMCKNNVCFR
jgi:hypothetical protein